MNCKTLQCGSTSLIKHIKNPVSVARLVMEKTSHNYLVGEGAEALARLHGLEEVNNSHFSTEKRRKQLLSAIEERTVQLDHQDEGAKGLIVDY